MIATKRYKHIEGVERNDEEEKNATSVSYDSQYLRISAYLIRSVNTKFTHRNF